ncbi:MAG TPA: hypothetical protein PLM53_16145 [Spirochaetota bacterium]|nr:hypothetical protein [Spirochaetota bacterium]HPC41378.1 hypothetical protein [Spirochaetota bacterium]HPL18439.1 hypothetical protein [Spirochaetota bacterium]HQF10033.1 hypothetical protein [Spirochaetota bacterium]HQH98628.1 hypothetical protein [Spirochaetota bacterium]
MKYMVIIFSMSLFVILYVWQNIEVVQIKMRNRALSRAAAELAKDNDRRLYEIERYRRMEAVEEHARKNGYRAMLPGDVSVVVMDKADAQ